MKVCGLDLSVRAREVTLCSKRVGREGESIALAGRGLPGSTL
jgi:hypothetical protein